MSLRKRVLYSCVLLLGGLLLITVSKSLAVTGQTGCTSYSCPPCYNDIPPLDGHGPVGGGDNRRKLYVFIDWGNPTPTSIYNGTTTAIAVSLRQPSIDARKFTHFIFCPHAQTSPISVTVHDL